MGCLVASIILLFILVIRVIEAYVVIFAVNILFNVEWAYDFPHVAAVTILVSILHGMCGSSPSSKDKWSK